MNKEILDILVCPECRGTSLHIHGLDGHADEYAAEGILACSSCPAWFLIENGILELIKDRMNRDRKIRFFQKHKDRLADWGVRYEMAEELRSLEVDQKRAQRDFFDGFAGDYVMETQNFWKAYYARMLRQFQDKIPQGSRILDLGCGTGLGAQPFLNERYTVVGIDISRGMLEKAVTRMPPAEKGRHLFFVADAEELPFKKDSFDCCIGIGILHHVHDAEKVVQAIHSCLKPRGIYFGHENNKTFFRPLFDLLMRINNLWHEEAGAEQLFSPRDIERLCAQFMVAFKTHVFLPPHFLNFLTPEAAGQILRLTDNLSARIPFLRDSGGTIVFEAQKGQYAQH